LVGEDFTVYVTDFGFARIKEKGGDGGNTQSTLGPVRHMSPESLKERRYSEKSDVYSFGVLLYEVRVVLRVVLRVVSRVPCAVCAVADSWWWWGGAIRCGCGRRRIWARAWTCCRSPCGS
jgi:serine/threonine protein kinase